MRILFIYSKEKTRAQLQRNLEQNAFTVDSQNDFARGLIWACANSYHAAIIEHGLPVLDADRCTEELRDRGCTFPILVLVSSGEQVIGTSCLNKGADDFMKAPHCISEFVARLRSLLRRPKNIEPDEISIGSLTIDRRKQIVKMNRHEIVLTRKEYSVLEILATNQGAIVSKGEIIEHTWGEIDGFYLEHALETHVSSLRRKFGKKGQKLIQNVFGRGYKLDA
jgi:DNA-binding response OmpR family regulator